jgi:hypothetical protein
MTKLVFASLMLSVASAAAADVPVVDVQRTCQVAAKTITGLFGDIPAANYDNCVSEEQAARDQIARDWGTYLAADKALCVQPKSYMPSYVEWLTCFEMQRSVRELRKQGPGER